MTDASEGERRDVQGERQAEGNGAAEEPRPAEGGPVPVRDLMKQMTPEPEGEGEPRWDGLEHAFEHEGVEWLVRSAGAGAYGTGRTGVAKLVAAHFYRKDDPETPVREALVPAGRFAHLWPDELRSLFDRATPIELPER